MHVHVRLYMHKLAWVMGIYYLGTKILFMEIHRYLFNRKLA